MKQIIPFIKEIEFDDNIASIISISLEHDIFNRDDEISGELLVYGEYKKHNDSTELFDFEEHIPFNLLVPDNLVSSTITIDVDDFTYEIVDDKIIKVCIDLSMEGEEIRAKDDARDLKDIWGLENEIESSINETNVDNEIDTLITQENVNNVNIENNFENNIEVNNTVNNIEVNDVNEIGEYVIYHIHIVNEGDTIENIINQYDTNVDIIKEYNDISKLEVGDKLIIPEIYYGTN